MDLLKSTSDIILQEIDGFTGDVKIPALSGTFPWLMNWTPESGSSLFESAMGFHTDHGFLKDFSTVGVIEKQDTSSAGTQGIYRYYAGLLPVTKTENLI